MPPRNVTDHEFARWVDARAAEIMFHPFRLGPVDLDNRVVVSAMDMYSATDGLPGDFHLVHLGGKALGGAGLVMTEMVCVSADARITPGRAGLCTPEHETAWHRVAEFAHTNSRARIGVRLGHAGRKGSTRIMWEGIDQPLPDGNRSLAAPSPLPYREGVSQVPRELAHPAMATVRDDVNSTVLADRADLCALARPHLYDPQWTPHAAAEQDYSGPGTSWPAPFGAGSRRPPTGRSDGPRPRLDLLRSSETRTTQHRRWRPHRPGNGLDPPANRRVRRENGPEPEGLTVTTAYGDHPSQIVHRWDPRSTDGPAPVAVLLHGGWWRDLHDARLMDPIARDLSAAGWAVWNIEYRRTGADGGGWPHTRDDVARALDLLAATAARDDRLDTSRVVSVGHSAGGHLALMTAVDSPVTSVVPLAPITDLRRCAEAGLGEGAVEPFLGPGAAPELYTDSSPLWQVPFGVPQLLVHGDRDQRVPVGHSRDYAAAARAAGDPVDYREVPGADHFVLVDPAHAVWRTVRETLAAGWG